MAPDNSITEKARKIKLLIMDVDGVLTDGRIILGNNGDEFKVFDVKDGFAIRMAQRVGLKTAIITARNTKIVEMRAKELEITAVYQNALVKAEAYLKLMADFQLQHEEAAYLGDDLIDLPVMLQVGLAITVPEAVEDVKQRAHYITRHSAGRGAVREAVELILKAQDLWGKATERYFIKQNS
ncbi:MAG: HAD hydrolase family protein [Candidatus Schekmanbacteria bacterium]|nr:HAD hydrolase family protein [Candidatus Schekmanbacteria bacterium]